MSLDIKGIVDIMSLHLGGIWTRRISMQRTWRAVFFALLALGLSAGASAAELKVGDKAPDFTLPDQNGKPVHLVDFQGERNVVLAFYVLAFTGG